MKVENMRMFHKFATGSQSKFRSLATALPLMATMCLAGCVVGPKYHKPAVDVPPAYKETAPSTNAQAAPGAPAPNWQPANPNDAMLKGKWWEIYNDPQLNALEEQVNLSNQNVLAAEANFRAARYAIGVARAALYPTVSIGPSVGVSRSGGGGAAAGVSSGVTALYNAPASAAWTADIWGSIRRSVNASQDTAQASFAQLENAR